MSPRYRCANGHAWTWEDSTQIPSSCPTCGIAVASTVLAPAPPPRADHDATVLQPSAASLAGYLFGNEDVPILPEYEILAKLGRGGMGVVYKARRRQDDRIVALKVIRKDRLQHEDAVRRFRREAQAMARLSHPNIVQVFTADQAGDLHYLVMEYIDGLNLDQLVAKQGPQPIPRTIDFLRQAALGLQHALERGLVHRDVKPSNLMVTPAPPPPDQDQRAARYGCVVKLLDMSVARLLQWAGQPDSLSTLTQGGAVIGTADYVAPEQLEDPRRADIRSDLYSLGCSFYFILTGQVPFPGNSLVAKLDQQRWQTPTSIHQLRDNVPPALVTIIQRLMAKNPRDRFRTPGELVQALEQMPRSGFASAPPLTTFPAIAKLTGHENTIWSLAWSADGSKLISGGKDRGARLWDVAAARQLRMFHGFNQDVRAVTFLPGNDRAALAVGAGIRLVDLGTGQELLRLTGHTAAVKCLLAAPDGKRLYSAGEDRAVRAWELPTGRDVQRFSRHTAEVTSLALVPPDGPLFSAGRDAVLRSWDLRSGQLAREIPSGGAAILALALSVDGRFLLTAHFDTLIRLWDVATGRELRRFLGHKQMVAAVAFLPDGERFLSAGHDGTVRVWDLETGVEHAHLEGATAPLHTLALSPDAKTVAAAGADKTIYLWNVP